VVPLHVPSLQERKEDIPLLAREFIRKYSENDKISLDPKLVDSLMEHTWPGNVRELEAVIQSYIKIDGSFS